MRSPASSRTGIIAGSITVGLSLVGSVLVTLLRPANVVVPSPVLTAYAAAALGAAAVLLASRRTNRAMRLTSLAIAAAALLVSVAALAATTLWPTSALALLDAGRPLHGV